MAALIPKPHRPHAYRGSEGTLVTPRAGRPQKICCACSRLSGHGATGRGMSQERRQEVQQPSSSPSSAPDTREGGRPVTGQQLAGPSFSQARQGPPPPMPRPQEACCPVLSSQTSTEMSLQWDSAAGPLYVSSSPGPFPGLGALPASCP